MPIAQLVMSDGERYPILLDENGMPDYWITLYVTEQLRVERTQASITNALGHLIHFQLWEQMNGRDLVDEFSRLEFLTDQDAHSLRDHCLIETKALKKWLASSSKTGNVSKFPSASTAPTASFKLVSKNHASNRMGEIASYLDFLAHTVLRGRVDTEVSGAIENMQKRLKANRPKGNSGLGLMIDPNFKAPPLKVFEDFMSVVAENSPRNPFKNKDIRFRNSLMFEVLYDTGLRSGELLALRIGDIQSGMNGAMLSVVRRHDTAADKRKKQPVAKTLERNITLDDGIYDRLYRYIMEVRANIPNARKHPYIFVTHKAGQYQGDPISNSAFYNRILQPAIDVDPDRFEGITRHGFRHNLNYIISKDIDEQNEQAQGDPSQIVSEKEEMDFRKDQFGWSSDDTAATYNRRHTVEKANKFMREHMDHHMEKLKKGRE
ncbi:site-specific integrase [Endozoicomonas sp. ONNA2]|uniref:site-specific integrase n=1 Tax=Endozoicomonas sp. ONNA2 TaxID=2828741 RepID=UPI002147B010|nr:site-specific integrase [Endozoicomonas sp. ONNA2]